MPGQKWSGLFVSPYRYNMAVSIVLTSKPAVQRIELIASLQSELLLSTQFELDQYLLGAMCDSTYNRQHGTIRFCQKNRGWLVVLKAILALLGHNSWIYKEGKDRQLWVCETKTFKPKSIDGNSLAFVRGFFDSDGGMPRNRNARLYFQFTQKSQSDIVRLKEIMEDNHIVCGAPHIPSKRVDPDYWRLFVRAQSHSDFMHEVGSWHPRKRVLVNQRLILKTI